MAPTTGTRSVVATCVTLAAVTWSATSAPAVDVAPAPDAFDALVNLASMTATPEQDVLADGVAVTVDGADSTELYAHVPDAGTAIPMDSDDPIIVGSDSPLPFAVTIVNPGGVSAEQLANGVVGYDRGDGTVTVPVLKSDGSVQVAIVIDDPQSPLEFDFEVGGEVDLRQYPDGSIGVYTADGRFVGGI